MAMTYSAVSVASDGTETLPAGSASTSLYGYLKAQAIAAMPAGQAFPTGAASAPTLQGIAATSNSIAQWLVTYVQANAVAVIPATAAGDGLQTTPSPLNPATATTRPAVAKSLAIT